MLFSCQKDSYLNELTTSVKSCVSATLQTTVNGKKCSITGYDVILADTVLFPEGGGQPDDRGVLNGIDVLRITRRGADAVHFVQTAIEPGTECNLKVDWTRRFDHMQQHTGQHLITAIAQALFGYKTTSWNLGEKICFIELDTPKMSADQISQVEQSVNAKIQEAVPVMLKIYEDKHDPEIKQFRTLGLPDDHTGPVRVINMEGIDAALCCGTHVSNLTHLQAIKLCSVEKGKKNKVNLYFLAGRRVLSYLGRCLETEKSLSVSLSGPPEQHAELADKMIKSYKQTQKVATSLLREIAVMEAQRLKSQRDKETLFVLHRKDGDNEFMNIVVNEVNDESVAMFLSSGDEKGNGLFMIACRDELLKELQPQISELLEAKGAVKKGRYQGKASKLSNRAKVEELLKTHLEKNET